MKSLDLKQEQFQKRANTPPVLRPRSITGVSGFRGSLPLKPSEIILTDSEKKKLLDMGWKDGDPLPGDLSTRIAEERQLVEQDMATAKPTQTERTKIPEAVDINNLDENRRNELSKYLQEFKKIAPQIEAATINEVEFNQLTPAAQKAIQDIGGTTVVDSRQNPFKAVQQRIDEIEGRAAPNEVEPVELKQPAASADVPVCNHCGRPPQAVPVEIAQIDNINYVTSILGGLPFRKSYKRLGGQITINFRQISTEHAEQIYRHVARELVEDQVMLSLQGASVRQVMIYRMLLSLETVTVGDQTLDVATTADSFLTEHANLAEDEKAATGHVLPALHRLLMTSQPTKNPLVKQSIWNMCLTAFTDFDHLCDALEVKAADTDFCWAIVP